MVDTDFEKDSREHLIFLEWQNADDPDAYLDGLIAKASPQWKGVDTDEFMDMVRGRKPETITEQLASVSEDWAVVLSEKPEPNPDCCTDTGGWENLVWVNTIKTNA